MQKLKLDLQDLNAEVLTRSQLKQILGGVASSGGGGGCDFDGCQWGANCFYSGPDGCGTAHCLGQDGYGNCTFTIHITTEAPCGWA